VATRAFVEERSAGERYMQASSGSGHSSFLLTLSTYADYIREDDNAAPALERPIAAFFASNVVGLVGVVADRST
jgi:integrase